MLNFTSPESMMEIASYPSGLMPVRESPGTPLALVIKGTKEMILTAKTKREFVVYLVPATVDGRRTYGLITAFSDDHDEPLTITTPVFDDEYAEDMFHIISSNTFDVHFFTEDNLELMAWRCKSSGASRVKSLLTNIELLPGSLELGRSLLDQMAAWFAYRTSLDDREALVIQEEERILTPRMIVDARPQANSYNGRKTTMYTTLERSNPGEQSELDIVALLLRVFPAKQIFLSPMRRDNGREFVDVLVSTPRCVVLIQAKDSPNTEEALQRSMTRKKAAIASQKAAAQLGGSISHIGSSDPVQIICGGHLHDISRQGRRVVGLIVVKELFVDEYSVYSKFAFDLFERTGVKCFILDMIELHAFAFHCRTEELFLEALEDVFVFAQKHGQFPRSRFGLVE